MQRGAVWSAATTLNELGCWVASKPRGRPSTCIRSVMSKVMGREGKSQLGWQVQERDGGTK